MPSVEETPIPDYQYQGTYIETAILTSVQSVTKAKDELDKIRAQVRAGRPRVSTAECFQGFDFFSLYNNELIVFFFLEMLTNMQKSIDSSNQYLTQMYSDFKTIMKQTEPNPNYCNFEI